MARSGSSHLEVVGPSDPTNDRARRVPLAMVDMRAPGYPIVGCNDAFVRLVHVPAAEISGQRLTAVLPASGLDEALDRASRGQEQVLIPTSVDHAAVHGGLQVTPVVEPDASIGRAIVVVDALPDREAEARHPGTELFDPTTGLPTAALFHEHAHQAIQRRARQDDDLAVAAIGVTGFARAWQETGEPATLLQAGLAERLEQVVRSADVLAARGTGRFLLLVTDRFDAAAAAVLASERMLTAVQRPIALRDKLQHVELCIGIAPVEPGDEPDTAIARADRAFADAVEAGPGTYRVHLSD